MSNVKYHPSVASNPEMLFHFEDVTKTYGAVTALNNLTLSVPGGGGGLLGSYWSGESNKIRAVLGLITGVKRSGGIFGGDLQWTERVVRSGGGFYAVGRTL